MIELDKYQNRGLVWYGNKNDQLAGRIKSGFPVLDQALSGGLPPQGVLEIKAPMGIGEIRLMLPYLKEKQKQGLLVFVAPPAMLDAEFLAGNGIDLKNVLVITEYDIDRTLWVTEQCLKSGSCGAVLLWQKGLSIKQSRRLMLASEQGESVLLLYRIMGLKEKSVSAFSAPSNVSMTLAAAPEGLTVNIDKQRGGRSFKNLSVDMRERWPDLTMQPISNENVLAFPKVIAH